MLFVLALILAIVAGYMTYQNVAIANELVRVLAAVAAGIVAYLATYWVASNL